MTQKSGLLDIYDGVRHATIVFREGNIVDARPHGSGPLTDELVSRGLIPPGAKEVEAPKDVRIGEHLVKLGYVTEEKLREVLVQRVEGAIYETLSWVNGEFEFDMIDPGAGAAGFQLADVLPGVNFNTQQVLMDALRVFDERRAGRAAAPEETAPVRAPSAPARVRVIVVSPEGIAERVRIALHSLPAEYVETRTIAEGMQALASDASRPGLVVLHVATPPPENLRDEIGHLVISARRVDVVTVGEDPSLAATTVSAGAWAHVGILRDGGPALAYLQSLAAARLEALSEGQRVTVRSAPSAGPLAGFSREISALRDRLDALAAEVHTSSVTMKILEFVAERLERGVLFLVRHGDLQGLGAFGHTAAGDPIGPLASGLRLPLGEDSVFARAVERRETLLCELDSNTAAARILYDTLGAPNPRDALLLPLISLGSAVALIYADNAFTGKEIRELGELEVMTRQAGLVLENALLRRMLERQGGSINGRVGGGT